MKIYDRSKSDLVKIDIMENTMAKGILRKYYYEKFENFKYQLMIIAGGTLTVFISFNRETDILPLYKWGFALLGLSLITGAISIFMFQIHLILSAEYDEVENELQKSEREPPKALLNGFKRVVSGGYFDLAQIIFGFLQLILFLTGLILIITGLIKT